MASPNPDRFEPLPPFTKLPRWLLGKLSRRGRIRLGVVSAVVAVLLGIAIAAQMRSGHRDVEVANTALDRRDAARQEALAEDQRPRFCFARQTGARSNYDIEVGYQFSAKADLTAGSAAWCKRNLRPLHPDTAYYKVPPVSPTCLPG